MPILLAKLWSVLPKLFEWPPVRNPAHALERLSLFLLVGGVVFEFVTGIMNIQQWYRFPGSFYTLHFYGAWVFTAAFVVHVGLKTPTVIRSLRSRGLLTELRTDTATRGRNRQIPGILSARRPRRRRSPAAAHWPSREEGHCSSWPCRWARCSAARCAAPPCSRRTDRTPATDPAASRST